MRSTKYAGREPRGAAIHRRLNREDIRRTEARVDVERRVDDHVRAAASRTSMYAGAGITVGEYSMPPGGPQARVLLTTRAVGGADLILRDLLRELAATACRPVGTANRKGLAPQARSSESASRRGAA